MPCDDRKPNKKEKDFSSFLPRTQPRKAMDPLFTPAFPPFFPSTRLFSPLLRGPATWLAMFADPELQLSADPE